MYIEHGVFGSFKLDHVIQFDYNSSFHDVDHEYCRCF